MARGLGTLCRVILHFTQYRILIDEMIVDVNDRQCVLQDVR